MSLDKRQKDAAGRLQKGARVQVRVPPDAADEVVAAAATERRTISDMIRVIIEDWAEGQRQQRNQNS